MQPRPNLTRLHKCNFQLRTCKPCPERTRKSKCSLFPSSRGVIRPISATKQPDLHFCNSLPFSVHPSGIANEGIRPRSYRGAHVSTPIGSYAQRLYRSHWTVDTWAVVDDSLARETVEGGRNGMRSADGENPPPNRRATAKRGIADVLPRVAGDDAAWASHPGPHDRTRPPSSSGVPVRGCAQVASGGRRRGLSGSRNRLSMLPMSVFHFPHFVATAAPSPPQSAMFHFPHFVAATAP